MKFRVLFAAAAAIALASCAKHHADLGGPRITDPPAPVATTPAGAVQQLQWALQEHNLSEYTALLTDNFAFVFAPNDSAGNRFPGHWMDRTYDAVAVQHMLVGGGAIPAALNITLAIDNPLIAMPDPRPGRDPKWHQIVRTNLNLQLTAEDNGTPAVTSVVGSAFFYVVRGDSAFLLPERAAARDSTRWFISRWEDETAGSNSPGAPGLHADPTQTLTLGGVKVRYLDPFPAAPAR